MRRITSSVWLTHGPRPFRKSRHVLEPWVIGRSLAHHHSLSVASFVFIFGLLLMIRIDLWAALFLLKTGFSLFRNKRFALDEMFQWNASKFAIFYVPENPSNFFVFIFGLLLMISISEVPFFVENRILIRNFFLHGLLHWTLDRPDPIIL